MNQKKFILGHNIYRENSVDPFIPEVWARESMALLLENMVGAKLVYRDFENLLAKYGDVVNVQKPAELVAKRKTNTDNVTIQDAIATNVQVPLNQHIHVTVLIRDGEESKSFKSLVQEFLKPQIIAMARFLDKMVLGQYPQFLANSSGYLNGLTVSNTRDEILNLREKFNMNKAPMAGRNLILNAASETQFLKLDLFTQAQQVGDSGEALRDAVLDKKLGFWMYMDQNMPVIADGNTLLSGLINNGAGYAPGATALVVDGFTGTITDGTWITIAGDDIPHQVVSHADTLGNLTSVVITPALAHAVVDGAIVETYVPGQVNLVAGYAAGYAKEIVVDTFSVAPKVGQIVSFGLLTTTPKYTVMEVNGVVGITLDRPLDVAIANDDKVNLGPAGGYNFAFTKNAMALVTRPLALPMSGTGARAANINYESLGMRVCITYSGEKQGHLVTVDMLAGIAVLDTALGGVMFG